MNLDSIKEARHKRKENRKISRAMRNSRRTKRTNTLARPDYYCNVLMLSPEGQPMNTIGQRKADWYLERNLATTVAPREGYKLVIQLNFAPKAIGADEFHRAPKPSLCVICGTTKDLTIHHVVPHCIRRHFPEKEKSRQHAWCVLMCEAHHHEIEEKLAPICHADLGKIKLHASFKFSPQERAISNLFSIKKHGLEHVLTKYPDRIPNLLKEAGLKDLSELPTTKNALARAIKPTKEEKENKLKAWALDYIERLGGIEQTKAFFRQTLLDLNPKFLAEGYLEDHQ